MFLFAASLVMGCASGQEYNDYAQSIDSSNKSGQEVLVAYYNKKAIDNQNIFKALGGSTDPQQAQNNQMAIVLYTILSQQNDEKILRYFTPKYADKPTTNADIGKSLADNFLPTLVKWGASAWLGGKVVDGLSASTYALGAGASMTQQSAGGNLTGTVSNTSRYTDGSYVENTDSYNPSGEASADGGGTSGVDRTNNSDYSVNTDEADNRTLDEVAIPTP